MGLIKANQKLNLNVDQNHYYLTPNRQTLTSLMLMIAAPVDYTV